MKKHIKSLAVSLGAATMLASGIGHTQTFQPQSAGDFGGGHPRYPAANVIDGNTNFLHAGPQILTMMMSIYSLILVQSNELTI